MDKKLNTLLFFGIAKDIVKSDLLYMDCIGNSVLELKKLLQEQYAELSDIKYFMVAINEVYASDDYIIQKGDKIAIIPPVSGG